MNMPKSKLKVFKKLIQHFILRRGGKHMSNENALLLYFKSAKEERALKAIKTLVDSIYNGNVTFTLNPDEADMEHHIYYIYDLMGFISCQAYEGLDLPIPNRQ